MLLCLWFATDMRIIVVSKSPTGKLQQYFLELINITFDGSASYNIIPTLKHETPLVHHSVKVKLQQYFLELMNVTFDGSASYNTIPPVKHETPSVRHSEKEKRKVYGTSSCNMARQSFKALKWPEQNEGSICQWYVYLDYDSDRLPQIIAKAGCTCTNCIGVMESFRTV